MKWMKMSVCWHPRKERSFRANSVVSCATKSLLGHSVVVARVIISKIHKKIQPANKPTEYITQLEAEVAKQTHEAELAKDKARRLEDENRKLRDFSATLMKHEAFQEFLKDISGPLMQQQQAQQMPQPRTVIPASVEPQVTFTRPTMDTQQHQQQQWSLNYPQPWAPANNNTQHVFAAQLPAAPVIQSLDGKLAPMAPIEEDFIADGFFSRIRDEKATINYDLMEDDDEYDYQAPEKLDDLFAQIESEKQAAQQQQQQMQGRDLDELFPGIGVNSLLERIEMVASGERRPEEVFDIQPQQVQQQLQVPTQMTRAKSPGTACRESNRMLTAAEGVYRRIGLTVGSKQ
jgi:hypothetical protein